MASLLVLTFVSWVGSFAQATLSAQLAGMPCGSEHTCCIRPLPQNVPELPSASSQQPPSEESRIPAAAAPLPDDPAVPDGADYPLTFREYSELSTILRI
jgi:hypothetical protein